MQREISILCYFSSCGFAQSSFSIKDRKVYFLLFKNIFIVSYIKKFHFTALNQRLQLVLPRQMVRRKKSLTPSCLKSNCALIRRLMMEDIKLKTF